MAQTPNHKFLYDEQTSLTFQQVYNLSGKVYAYLKVNGIGKEDFVLINLTKTIFDAIREIGHIIDYVSDSEFKSKVDIMKNDPEKVKYLQGIMHYEYHNNSNKKVMPAENQWTTAVLVKFGFRWEKTEEEYLTKFLKFLEAMQVFDV